MSVETKIIKLQTNFTGGLVLSIGLFYVLFFTHGCYNKASIYEQYLNAEYGIQYSDVNYPPVVSKEGSNP